jgi:hypothetical protein
LPLIASAASSIALSSVTVPVKSLPGSFGLLRPGQRHAANVSGMDSPTLKTLAHRMGVRPKDA